MTNLLVFPGQGSQFVGMGKAFADNFAASREVYEEVNESLGQNLTKIMWEGDMDELTKTENAQPAIMSVSIAVLRAIETEIGIDFSKVSFVAGHSLGEYSALVAVRSLNLSVAAKLLRLRGQSMQKAVPLGEGAMAALIGADINNAEDLVNIITSKYPNRICDVANDNAPGQVVVSGHSDAIEAAMEISSNYGAKRALKLPVSAPFHSRLMEPAAEIMDDAFQDVSFSDPIVPLISNVTASMVSSGHEFHNLLVKQITERVRWTESIKYAFENGVVTSIEIGAGKVLTGMIKRISGEANTISVSEPNQIDEFKL
ncbi:MAG: [acyl-carrier-protein] S-malonyltransferase [Alphaproteobacteria bacterium]|nr:[acyl-carrier-protein] S-malonyltransferase [Alphaproteobacteria bacterium]